jgi:Xaa-Pro aminopeptidase
MRTGDPGVPELHDWLLSNEALDVVVVGVDAALVSTAWAKRLQTLLGDKKKLTAVTSNPVAEVWGTDRPPLPANPVAVHPLDLAGESYQSKVSAVQKALTSGGAGCVVLTTLDEVAWLFNIRYGSRQAGSMRVYSLKYSASLLMNAVLYVL